MLNYTQKLISDTNVTKDPAAAAAAPREERRRDRIARAWLEWTGKEITPGLKSDIARLLVFDDPLNDFEQLIRHACKSPDTAAWRRTFRRVAEQSVREVRLRAVKALEAWEKEQIRNDNTYDTRRVQDAAARERWIKTPLAARIPDEATEARWRSLLLRKAANTLQAAVLIEICNASFEPPDYAEWVPVATAAIATSHAVPRAAVDLALWQASIAGLCERRRFGGSALSGEWRYTAVPEIWDALPDHGWSIIALGDPKQLAPRVAVHGEDDEEDDARGNRAETEARA